MIFLLKLHITMKHKQVAVTFVGSDDIPQHIVSIRKKNKIKNKNKINTIETFFNFPSCSTVTSNYTLSHLNTPKLNTVTLNEALLKVKPEYLEEKKLLYNKYYQQFNKWMLQMCNGFNILLYGVGSKHSLMENFRTQHLSNFSHVVVNGYFPNITIKQILNSITEGILECSETFNCVVEHCNYIRKRFSIETYKNWFLVIHNIDGFRAEKFQMILSLLAQTRGVHIIASIDHINASLLWDQAKASRFCWLWYDVTTFDNYINETSYETSLMVQHGVSTLSSSSITRVMESLTFNAKKIFMLIAKHQLNYNENITFSNLYQECRKLFLVNSEITLRTQLVEFKNHKLIRFKKNVDGFECLNILLNLSTLFKYVSQEKN